MAFEGLTEKLSAAFKKLRGKGRLSEADVKEAMREIRLALLEADVSYKVVKQFIAQVTEKAVGADVLEALEGVDVSQIQVPLGSLVDLDILWGLGPTLKVHAMTVGTVDGEFFSEFTSAGVNQTLHRICLKLTVPLTLMLPGGAVETVSETELCVAETVIVGQVPQAYLNAGQ